MVAPFRKVTEPPCPLTPALRDSIVFLRARGHSWEEVAARHRYDADALRRAAERDPEFAAAQERAWDEAVREAEAVALERLRQVANGSDPKRAAQAAKLLARNARDRHRDEERLAAARAAAQQAKADKLTEPAAPEARPLKRFEMSPDW